MEQLSHPTEPVHLNQQEILDRLDGDWSLLAELSNLALAELPRMIDTLDQAAQSKDPNVIHRAVHRLIGSLGVFGPGPHTTAANELQEMARDGNIEPIPELFERLKLHLVGFRVAVESLAKEAHARADSR